MQLSSFDMDAPATCGKTVYVWFCVTWFPGNQNCHDAHALFMQKQFSISYVRRGSARVYK